MKLGATITSERGKAVTKTGNEHILIKLNDEKGNILYEVWFSPFSFIVYEQGKEIVRNLIGNLKHGKECFSMAHNEDIEKYGHCLECQWNDKR